jgi:hypothetical protein
MSPTIQLSAALYKRLEEHAQGFDTPENVIERLLNSHEINSGADDEDFIPSMGSPDLARPEPIFYPSDINKFKDLLLQNKQAYRRITYRDGTAKLSVWNAERFDAGSNLLGNIYSGVLRNWSQKGIVRAEFAIEKQDLPANGGAKMLHLIEKMGHFEDIDGNNFTSGYWALPEAEATAWVGHPICFHKTQAEPSYSGGLITGYERVSNGEYAGRIVFHIKKDDSYTGVSTDTYGWQRWLKRA